MKTQKELEADILKLTMHIQEKHPELSKYIDEMPVTIPNVESPEINAKILQDYYNSLDSMLKKYVPNHNEAKEEHK
jgi:hypothetical protein